MLDSEGFMAVRVGARGRPSLPLQREQADDGSAEMVAGRGVWRAHPAPAFRTIASAHVKTLKEELKRVC